jgi:hypothetical protein
MKNKILILSFFASLLLLTGAGSVHADALWLSDAAIDNAGVLTNSDSINVPALGDVHQFSPEKWTNIQAIYVDGFGNQTLRFNKDYSGYCGYISGGCHHADTTVSLTGAISYYVPYHNFSYAPDNTHYKGNFYVFFMDPNVNCVSVADCQAKANVYIVFSQTADYPAAQNWTTYVPITAPESVFTDNFEGYNLGYLGNQGTWWSGSSWQVESSFKYSGNRALSCVHNSGIGCRSRNNGTPETTGTGSYFFFIDPTSGTGHNETLDTLILNHDESYGCGYFGIYSPSGSSHYTLEDDNTQTISMNAWHLLTWEWSGTSVKYKVDSGAWTTPRACWGNTPKAIDQFRFDTENSSDATFYIDDIGAIESIPPPTPGVSITAPSNTSTVTSSTTNITGTFTAISPTIYHDLELSFTSGALGEASTPVFISDLSDGSGSFSIPISQFSLPSNGKWYLKAHATYKNTQLSEMLISDDLISPSGYYINLNINGLNTAYQFTNFNTWYSQNSAGGYSAPSDFANSITDFFTPIFERAGGFANQVIQYFNSNEAYDKGNQLGLVFPTTQAYINKINIFFGGFPLIQFFEFSIVVMLGIFIIRTIFKFIPFFG